MNYQYIKLAYFEDNFAGDNEFIQEILQIFLEDIPIKMKSLTEQVRNNDWPAAAETAHSIKASVKMMGLDSLYDDIVSIEHAAKNDPSQAEIQHKLSTIEAELKNAKVEIEHYLSTLT